MHGKRFSDYFCNGAHSLGDIELAVTFSEQFLLNRFYAHLLYIYQQNQLIARLTCSSSVFVQTQNSSSLYYPLSLYILSAGN